MGGLRFGGLWEMTNSRSLLLAARKVAFRSFSGISWSIILYGFLINLQFWVLLSTFSPSITNNHALLLNQIKTRSELHFFVFRLAFPLFACLISFLGWRVARWQTFQEPDTSYCRLQCKQECTVSFKSRNRCYVIENPGEHSWLV